MLNCYLTIVDSVRRIIVVSLLFNFLLLGACSTSKIIRKKVDTLYSSTSDNHFTGIMLFDPDNKDTIVSYNSAKYFTPASNTKIFTLYTALKLLPPKVPAFKYLISKDTLIIVGTGDPSFFHPIFKDSSAFNYIKNFKHLAIYLDNYYDPALGPGWAWEDYDLSFSPERNSFPLYGNVVTIFKDPNFGISPDYFSSTVLVRSNTTNREKSENIFYFPPERKDTLYIPFITKDSVVLGLLEGIFKKKINHLNRLPSGKLKTYLGSSRDSLAKEMMQKSDNFLAEQILIMGSSAISDSLSSKKTINHMLDNYLNNLKQAPRWVDGSGLSRYNLFSPESLVDVLYRMYMEYDEGRLFNLFAVGGESGTIKEWYASSTDPYIYAKTGSLGNNHCLSGYLKTDSGKILLFSIMNNHFRQTPSEIKERMQEFLAFVKVKY